MSHADAISRSFFSSSIKYLPDVNGLGSGAGASEKNLDQDIEKMRDEGKGCRCGIGEPARCLHILYVCVCVCSKCVATWGSEYERCQPGLCSSAGGVN